MKTVTLTEDSFSLFLFPLARDASNWSGNPLVDISPKARGNLTQLKRAKLLSTYRTDGDDFVQFTDAGRELAAAHGIDLGEP